MQNGRGRRQKNAQRARGRQNKKNTTIKHSKENERDRKKNKSEKNKLCFEVVKKCEKKSKQILNQIRKFAVNRNYLLPLPCAYARDSNWAREQTIESPTTTTAAALKTIMIPYEKSFQTFPTIFQSYCIVIIEPIPIGLISFGLFVVRLARLFCCLQFAFCFLKAALRCCCSFRMHTLIQSFTLSFCHSFILQLFKTSI